MQREELSIRGKTVADYKSFSKTFIKDALEQGLLQTQHGKDGQLRYEPATEKDCRLDTQLVHTETGEPLEHIIEQRLQHRRLRLLVAIHAVYRDGELKVTLSWYPWSEPIAKYILEKMHETMNAPYPEWMIRDELEAKQLRTEFVFGGTGEDLYRALDHHFARQKRITFESYLGSQLKIDRRTHNFIEGTKGRFENATLEIWQKEKESENNFTVIHLGEADEWITHLSVDREKLRQGLKIEGNDDCCLRIEYKGRTYNISTCPTPIREGVQHQVLQVRYHAWSRNIDNYKRQITFVTDKDVRTGKFTKDIEPCLGIEFEVAPTIAGKTAVKVSCFSLFEPMYDELMEVLKPHVEIQQSHRGIRTTSQRSGILMQPPLPESSSETAESWTMTGTIRLNEWPKREFMTFEKVRLEDFHRWFTKFHLNKWNTSEKSNQFVLMTSLKVKQSDGENEYIFQDKENQAVVAVITAERLRIDELRLNAVWFEPANEFINHVIGSYCVDLDLPFFDWMKPQKQVEQPLQSPSSQKTELDLPEPAKALATLPGERGKRIWWDALFDWYYAYIIRYKFTIKQLSELADYSVQHVKRKKSEYDAEKR